MWEGIDAVGKALISTLADKRLAPQEAAAKQQAIQELAKIQGGMGPEGITQEQMQGLGDIRGNPYAPEGVQGVIGALMRRKMTPEAGVSTVMGQPIAGAPGGFTGQGFSPQMGEMTVSSMDLPQGDATSAAHQKALEALRTYQQNPTGGTEGSLNDASQQFIDRAKGQPKWRDKATDVDRFFENNAPDGGVPPQLMSGIPNGPMSGAGGGRMARTDASGGPMVAQADTGTATDGTSMKLTEGQSKDLNFWNRMDAVTGKIDAHAPALMEFGQKVLGGVPLIGNMMISEDYQRGKRDADEWIVALLRKDTGAQVTREEWATYGPIYIPQPGDGPETLKDKAEARKRAARGMERGLGTAEVLAEELKAEREKGKPPTAPASGDWRSQDPSTWTDEQLQEFTK
jgi:hypothetical protein